MKARYNFRTYPTDQQEQALAKLFGCCRVVWNDFLAQSKAEKYEGYNTNAKSLTQLKKTPDRVWLGEVSIVPLQQSLRQLDSAFKEFFKSCKGKRKGKKSAFPRFKKWVNRQSAEFTKRGFTVKGDKVYLARIGEVNVVWSRELPSEPSSVTVIKDCANRYFLSFVVEVEPQYIEPLRASIGIDLGLNVRVVGETKEEVPEVLLTRKHLVNREGSQYRNRENLLSVKVRVLPPRHQVESIVSSFKEMVNLNSEAVLKAVRLIAHIGATASN